MLRFRVVNMCFADSLVPVVQYNQSEVFGQNVAANCPSNLDLKSASESTGSMIPLRVGISASLSTLLAGEAQAVPRLNAYGG